MRKKLVSHQVDGVILRVASHTYSFASSKEKKTCMGNCEGALFYTDHNFLGHLPLNGIYDSFYVFPRFFLKHQFISISLGDGIKHIKHGREVFFSGRHTRNIPKKSCFLKMIQGWLALCSKQEVSSWDSLERGNL